MKTRTIITLVLCILVVIPVAGCASRPTRAQPTTPTENVAATVGAAVEATRLAEESQSATIEAAVAQTQTAVAPPSPTAIPEEQPTALPTETALPSSEDYVTMTEEELATLIDQTVNEAVAATLEASETAETSTADGTLTAEEVETIEVTLAEAEAAIALAEELIYAYTDLYVELAEETLIVLQEVEQLLIETTELVVALTDLVYDVDDMLTQGIALSEETISELVALAEAAGANAAAIEAQATGWLEALQAELEARAIAALALQPTEIATDRKGAIQSAYGYIEAVNAALMDSKISQQELAAIAQAGANASASLQAYGGPQLQDLAASLNDITAMIAQGQLPDIQGLIATLQSSLPPLPSLP